MDAKYRGALDRLIGVAQRDSGQSRRVANLLLCWWNADTCGRFDFRDLWSLDADIKTDAVWLIVYIATHQTYPDSLGFGGIFEALVRKWRPRLVAAQANPHGSIPAKLPEPD